MFSILDWLFYGKAYAEAVINDSPVFILGHPRTGTTLLHNLLVCNKIPTVLTVFPHPPFRHYYPEYNAAHRGCRGQHSLFTALYPSFYH